MGGVDLWRIECGSVVKVSGARVGLGACPIGVVGSFVVMGLRQEDHVVFCDHVVVAALVQRAYLRLASPTDR